MYVGMLERGQSKLRPWHELVLDALAIKSGRYEAYIILLDATVRGCALNYKTAERLRARLKMQHYRAHFLQHLSWSEYKHTNFWHIEKVIISD